MLIASSWDSFWIGVVFGINLVSIIRLMRSGKGGKDGTHKT